MTSLNKITATWRQFILARTVYGLAFSQFCNPLHAPFARNPWLPLVGIDGSRSSEWLALNSRNAWLRSSEQCSFWLGITTKQRIILVASDFDEQTLSAVAWLNSNGVDMSCYRLTPYKLNESIYFHTEKILPVTIHNDYYVDLMDRSRATTVRRTEYFAILAPPVRRIRPLVR